jgi:hypothetical protein
VTNRGKGTYIVRLRPASNRKAGFFVSKPVKPGDTMTIPLPVQGSFDINIQFLDTDGNVKNSWTADQPVDLRKRTYPETGDNLSDAAMLDPPRMGTDGKMVMGAMKRMPLLKGMRFTERTQQLYQVGAVDTEDPKNPKVDFAGAVTVGEKLISFRMSGPPRDPSIAIGGEPYKLADLEVFGSLQEGRVVLSGTYSGGGRAGEFLLERRDGFPFYRLNLDLKARGESDWSSFQLDVVFELQRPLTEGQARIEQRLAAMEASLNGRLAELELRLVDPKVFRIVNACVNCHRTKPGPRSPLSLSALLPNIPKMSAATTEDMIQRSKLDEQDKARFLNYAKELAKTLGP